MEKPLKLFLGSDKNYATINLDEKLKEISKMQDLGIYDIGNIMASLERENKGKHLNFELRNYGAPFDLNLHLPIHATLGKPNILPLRNSVVTIKGETLTRNISYLFNQAVGYAIEHNVDYVIIQNLGIKPDFPSLQYKLTGLAQLLLR